MTFLGELALILIVTLGVSHFCNRINIPAVVGELLVGVILGPALLGWLRPSAFMHDFSEMGVVLLMYLAGLESDLGLLKKYFKPSVFVAVLGVVMPMVLMPLASLAFGLTQQDSILVGVVFAATSVSISVVVLRDANILSSKEGTTILGAAVVDDILAVLLLSVLSTVMGTGQQVNLSLKFGLELLYFVGLFVAVKWVVPGIMSLSEHLQAPYAVVITALVLGLALAELAELVGLSDVVGAFFAGIAIGQTKYRDEIVTAVEPIGYAVFIPVFFVSIGLNMSFAGIQSDFWFIVVMSLLAIATKLFGAGLGARLAGFSHTSAYLVGCGMVSRGEMALIVAQIGYRSHLLSKDYYSSLILVILITTLVAPFMIQQAVKMQKARPN
ncbi:cation:proton antiporter [Lactobacillus selangorensis]|nr:cation:proton antiporter [Lactobacillus selangorensis]